MAIITLKDAGKSAALGQREFQQMQVSAQCLSSLPAFTWLQLLGCTSLVGGVLPLAVLSAPLTKIRA